MIVLSSGHFVFILLIFFFLYFVTLTHNKTMPAPNLVSTISFAHTYFLVSVLCNLKLTLFWLYG